MRSKDLFNQSRHAVVANIKKPMKKQTKTILVVAILLIAAYVIYKKKKAKEETTPKVSSPATQDEAEAETNGVVERPALEVVTINESLVSKI